MVALCVLMGSGPPWVSCMVRPRSPARRSRRRHRRRDQCVAARWPLHDAPRAAVMPDFHLRGTPMSVLRMSDLDLSGKRVLIREDLNVPIEDGRITSGTRILAALPTIRLALEKGAAVMVTSHLGRPEEGRWSEEDSLAPVA